MKVGLHIEVDQDDGSFTVNGPFHSLVLCYGLLEIARDVCQDEARKLKLGIVQAQPADVREVTKSRVQS
jgi:hypothetical protein